MPITVFLSHSTYDDATVTALRQALEPRGVSVWADSQRLSAGDALPARIQEVIRQAQHFMVLVSPRAINAPWVHKEVQRAQHVVHFDGHGVYDRTIGLGALCFEDPADTGRLTRRRSVLVSADDLASVLRDHRVPLVFLEACQTAHAEDTPTASVAARLLQQGVASVVAISHSVLVETARRFVTRFYHELLRGARLGQAMLAGQRELQQNPARGKVLQHELRLQDWFVPVLLQEEADPVLLTAVPDARLRAVLTQQHQAALGALPEPPPHRFIGRSRELLTAERRLCAPTNPQPGASAPAGPARYVVLRGEGGEGKTTLAVELARWLVHSRRFARTAFVSLEDHRDAEAVRFSLGTQLVPDYVAQGGTDPATGEQLLTRVLRRDAVLLVFDNMESVLPPPGDDGLAVMSADSAALFEPDVLAKILDLARRLNAMGGTRLLFTSREALPEPFQRRHIPLDRLDRADAITLVGQVLAEQPDLGPRTGQAEEDEQAIADLVDAVGCHARSLVLLAREVGRAGVCEATAAPTWDNVVDIATSLEDLLRDLGRPRALASVADIRARAAAHLDTWSRTRFGAELASVERLQNAGRLAEAVAAACTLLRQAQAAGPDAYPGAAYHLAIAHFALGRMLKTSGDAEAALALLAKARAGFTALAEAGNTSAARMASVYLTESGECLVKLGRLDDAVAAYETAIALGEQRHDRRSVATNKGNLGTVRLWQRDYPAALAAHTEARETFAQLNEPAHVAVAWHQIGRVHEEAGQYEAAEHAYQASLRISMQLGDTAGQARTLGQLGSLYNARGRLEDAVSFHLQAADMRATLRDLAGEGGSRNNAAIPLIALRRYDEARRELQRAIACKAPFGHAAELWKTFDILSDLERAVGNTTEATAARQRALDAYLAYRRAGGVSQSPQARLYTLVAQALATRQSTAAAAELAEIAQHPNLPAYVSPALAALQAILAGSRAPALADDPRLLYRDAAELRLLLDQLGPA